MVASGNNLQGVIIRQWIDNSNQLKLFPRGYDGFRQKYTRHYYDSMDEMFEIVTKT